MQRQREKLWSQKEAVLTAMQAELQAERVRNADTWDKVKIVF